MTEHHQIERQIVIIIIAFLCITTLIGARLFYLQIIKNEYLQGLSEKNFFRFEAIPSPRGDIVASDGTLLATNRPVVNVYWAGTGSYQLTPEHQAFIKELEKLLSISLLDNREIINKIKYAERYHTHTCIATDISFTQLSQLQEQFPAHANIFIHTSFKRYYPYKTYASHIIGYTRNNEGKMGLELLLDESLHGLQGTKLKTINSFGRKIWEKEITPHTRGATIRTTLNINLQHIAESVFPSNYTGALIIMDPHTGALLAVLSRPHFDPNIFLNPIDPLTWQSLQIRQPFLNRAFNSCYPPGSIFKLITISAALEHHLIEPDSCWPCKGYITFAKRRYWCHKHYGHGLLTTQQALAHSCNILFFEIGKRMPIDLLAEYAQKFGLGKPTSSLLPEKVGLVPTTVWKHTVKKERWWQGETLSATIGQSYLLASPIQIIVMIASIFTNYLVAPRILENECIQKSPLPIQPSTLEFLKRSMKKVVREGTGRGAGDVTDMRVYAKTSTAQTSNLEKRTLGSEYLEHGWFAAYCQYKNHPPIAFVIVVENAGSSQVPKDIARCFLKEYKLLIDQHDKEHTKKSTA